MTAKYFVIHTNPEPWAIGTISYGRMSPNLTLDAFKRAVKEELEGVEMLPPDYRKFTFYFFRQQARYIDMNDKIRQRNQADATNMQKALEDALQGVLFKNDRDTLDIRSVIVDQGPDVMCPGAIIRADKVYSEYKRHVLQEIPQKYLDELLDLPSKDDGTDRWATSEDLF